MTSEESMAHWFEQDTVLAAATIEAALERDLNTWRTRDGREIPIRKMDDDHLLNAERFLRGDGEQPVASSKRFEGYRREKLQRLRNELSRRALARLHTPIDPSADANVDCSDGVHP